MGPRTVTGMEGAAEPPEGQTSWEAEADRSDRLTAYSYLTGSDRAVRAEYLAIMRVFTATLLADLSAHEVAERLSEQGRELPVDIVAARLASLASWGVLLPSSRPVRVASIREYQRARARYQLSSLGERVQRHAEEIISTADSAREVSRELLALVARGLAELDELAAAPGGGEPTAGLAIVTTLFAQFGAFADSVRDFYAYLGQVIFRYDLDTGEFLGFKELLLDYAETITDEVSRFAPQIETSLEHLWPVLPRMLDRFDRADQGLAALEQADVRVERSRGRRLADWEGLRAWFFSDGEQASQVGQLRDATLRALQALLANAKRMIRSSAGELSRRRDLLRLAGWFDGADDATAHDLFVAAFGLYPARHLGVVQDGDRAVPASVSWWHGPTVTVAKSIQERGSRAARGRTAAAEDYREQAETLRRQAEDEAARRHAAAAELLAVAGRLSTVRLSAAATRLLLDLLARAVAGAGPGFATAASRDEDLGVALRLTSTPGRDTTVRRVDGDLTVEGHAVDIEAASGEPLTATGQGGA
jgi:uncharacterized protein (TIGR02677 family)